MNSFNMGDLIRLKVLFVQLQVWYRDMGTTHRGGNVDLGLTITESGEHFWCIIKIRTRRFAAMVRWKLSFSLQVAQQTMEQVEQHNSGTVCEKGTAL